VRMTLANPRAFLLLLAVVPLLYLLYRQSRVYLPPRRRELALAIRIGIAALVVLALAGPRLLQRLDRLTVVYLVDLSDSVTGDARQKSVDYIRESMKTMGARDLIGIVAFGENALVEQPLSHPDGLGDLSSIPITTHTDLAGAVRTGTALLTRDTGRRLIVLSDGNENLGSARDEVKLAAAAGIQVSVVPLTAPTGPRVLLSKVETPAIIRKADNFDMQVTIESNVAGTAKLRLFTDGALTGEENVTLKAGSNTFTYPQKPLPQGFHSFSAQLESGQDPIVENKQASSFSTVIGQSRVLLLEGAQGEGKNLADALTATGTMVDVRSPSALPPDLAGLRAYDSVMLVNVPASSLTTSGMRLIAGYVRDLGGGLVVVGGDKSFGAGGYGQTPLEEALPVSAAVNPRKNLPSSAVVFIIESLESNLGVDISKEAAKAAMQSLTPQDEVGVMDGNDGAGIWVVPLQRLTDKAAVAKKIDAMQPGDPSTYTPFFAAARSALAGSQARTKHVLLLGDGDATDSYEQIVRGIAVDGASLSVVGTNVAPSDLNLLQNLAQWGNGRYYDGNDPFDIPQLLTRETQLIARPAIVEEAFKPAVTSGSVVLQGIAPDSLPALRGYIATTAKPAAQVLLASNQADPVLSEWQYGLGRVLAWTSDAKGQWAADWVAWPQFGQFWSQVVRRSLPPQVDQNVQTTITTRGPLAHIAVDSVTPDHKFRDNLQSKVTIFDPKQRRTDVALEQSAPGRYEGNFAANEQGTYLLQVVQSDPDGSHMTSQTSGYVVPYSPEYRELGTNTQLLGQLAAATGGAVLTEPVQAFKHDLPQASGARDLAPYLLVLALFGFLFDVAIRRLRLTTLDIAAAWKRVWNRDAALAPDTPAAGAVRGLRERVAQVRAQARQETGGAVAPLGRRSPKAPVAPATPSTFARVSANLDRRAGPGVTLRDGAAHVQRAPIPSASTVSTPPASARPAPTSVVPRQPVAPKPPTAPAPRKPAAAAAPAPATSRLLEAKERARKRNGA